MSSSATASLQNAALALSIASGLFALLVGNASADNISSTVTPSCFYMNVAYAQNEQFMVQLERCNNVPVACTCGENGELYCEDCQQQTVPAATSETFKKPTLSQRQPSQQAPSQQQQDLVYNSNNNQQQDTQQQSPTFRQSTTVTPTTTTTFTSSGPTNFSPQFAGSSSNSQQQQADNGYMLASTEYSQQQTQSRQLTVSDYRNKPTTQDQQQQQSTSSSGQSNPCSMMQQGGVLQRFRTIYIDSYEPVFFYGLFAYAVIVSIGFFSTTIALAKKSSQAKLPISFPPAYDDQPKFVTIN